MSEEEEKEQRQFRDYMRVKQTFRGSQRHVARFLDADDLWHGKELYAKMIKKLHLEFDSYSLQ